MDKSLVVKPETFLIFFLKKCPQATHTILFFPVFYFIVPKQNHYNMKYLLKRVESEVYAPERYTERAEVSSVSVFIGQYW